MRNKKQEKIANDQHINDLQFRLDMVASRGKPKGFEVQIGSNMPYTVLRRRQFGDFTSSVIGKIFNLFKRR